MTGAPPKRSERSCRSWFAALLKRFRGQIKNAPRIVRGIFFAADLRSARQVPPGREAPIQNP